MQDSLVATRTLCKSPFLSDNGKVLYAGGMDCNSILMSRTAWIYKADFNTLSVNENENTQKLLVYPNPLTSKINIAEEFANEEFDIVNSLGQIIYSGNKINEQDFSSLENGIYFILQPNNKLKPQKIIKN